MVIDDELDTRSLMRAFLTAELPEAIDVRAYGDVDYRDGRIDFECCAVAIVDVMMPVVDGRAILTRLRDEWPGIRRIAWTAAPEVYREEIVQQCLAHAVVAKPGLDELRALVLAAL